VQPQPRHLPCTLACDPAAVRVEQPRDRLLAHAASTPNLLRLTVEPQFHAATGDVINPTTLPSPFSIALLLASKPLLRYTLLATPSSVDTAREDYMFAFLN